MREQNLLRYIVFIWMVFKPSVLPNQYPSTVKLSADMNLEIKTLVELAGA